MKIIPELMRGGVKYVVNSIKSYGFKIPMVIDKNNVIVCGHTRYKAAQELGMDKVPCIVADDLTDDQIKAFRIADNKVADFSLWDNKLLLQELDFLPDDLFTGFDISETFNELLDEKDNSVIEENTDGVVWRAVFESENKSKIEKINELWEGLDGEDFGGGNIGEASGGGVIDLLEFLIGGLADIFTKVGYFVRMMFDSHAAVSGTHLIVRSRGFYL